MLLLIAALLAAPRIDVDGTWRTLTRAQITRWVRGATEEVAAYYGRFPAPRAEISVESVSGSRGIHGRTFRGRFVRISLGEDASAEDLRHDWVMVHELVHLSFPELGDAYDWMEEGLATYLEPVIQARAGAVTEAEFWKGVVQGMPRGLPEDGDRGLDRTHTWGRTYWGGALYWLLCDVELREAGKSLDDVLRYILAQGGDGAHTWTLDQLFAAAKRATGLDTLRTLHARYGLQPGTVDLDALWKRLGVASDPFDDRAPLANIRAAITRRGAPRAPAAR